MKKESLKKWQNSFKVDCDIFKNKIKIDFDKDLHTHIIKFDANLLKC